VASGERITGTKFWRGRYRCGGTICTSSCKKGHVDGLSFDADGNRFRSKAAAKKAATLREIEVQAQGIQTAKNMTFRLAAEKFCATDREGVKQSTNEWYSNMTRAFFGKFPAAADQRISTVTTDQIDDWLKAIRDNESMPKQHTIDGYRNTLHAIFKHALRKKWIVVNPVLNADTPISVHGDPDDVSAFTEDELNRLADAIDPRFRLLVLLGGYSGLRIGELAGLQADDLIEWVNGGVVLHVTRQYKRDGTYDTTKTKKPKKSPVAPHVVPLLKQHLKDYPPSETQDGSVFSTAKGLPLHYGNFMNRVWKPAIAAAAVPALGTHSMRHHFADYCRDNGIPIEVTADWGGWSSPRMLQDVYRTKNSESDISKYTQLLASDRDEHTDDQVAASR